MTSRANIVALWIVISAVLYVLVSPMTPGAIAPQGGKLLKPVILLALNTFSAGFLLACFPLKGRAFACPTGKHSNSTNLLALSLRC